MFERFDELSKRSLFIARYEASEQGSSSLDAQHLVLRLLRVAEGVITRLLERPEGSLSNLRGEVESRCLIGERISTSIEIPFAPEVMHALEFAVEETDLLKHIFIQPGHLLLGILREGQSAASGVLVDHGIPLHNVPTRMAGFPNHLPPS